MELALNGLQWNICLIYLDDVIIFSTTFEEHTERLKQVLTRIKDAGLKLKPRKCHLYQEKVTFLGHVLTGEGVLPNPENIEKIINWPVPTNVTEVRTILGMASYYRRFVKDFSKRVHALVELTKKNNRFHWTFECQREFEDIKETLTGPEIMGYPLDDGKFILDTDACDVSIGAVLSQMQDGRERVIAYASRTLNKAERNYCVTDRELLAIRYFTEYFRQYLLGRHFTVRTDHQALKWLFSLKEPKSRIARWIEVLSSYDFEVEYRKGNHHGNADGMSRCPNPRDCQCSPERLKCGPCKKCEKRTEDMQSTMVFKNADGVRKIQSQTCNTKSQVKLSSVIYMWLMILIGLCCTGFYRVKELTEKFRTRFNAEVVSGRGYLWCYLTSMVNVTRDALWLSRGYAEKVVMRTTKSKTWIQGYTSEEIRKSQLGDTCIGKVLRWVESGARPYGQEVCSSSPAVRHYWNCWDSLIIEDGVLCKKTFQKDGTNEYLQCILPESMRREVLHQMHDGLLAGHLGKKKTKMKILQRFYWWAVREDVNNWIDRCDNCSANKMPPHKPKAAIGDMRVGAPMDRLATDILGPLPLTPRGNRYIMVVSDYFSNWVEILPIPDQSGATCANKILDEVISRYGCPIDIHSDQGSNYRSEIFTELCKLLEVRKTRTSPKNPKCNGKVERFNRTLIHMIRAYLRDEQEDWDLHLGCLAGAYRATPHEVTKMTPNLMMLGREVRLPTEILVTNTEEVTNYGEYVEKVRGRLQRAHEVARMYLQKKAVRMRHMYDGKTMLNKYVPGDYVWYLKETRKIGVCVKLQRPYGGPYLVVKKINELDYIIQMNEKGSTRLVHHDKLKPYLGDKVLKWAKKAIRKSHK